MTQTSNEVICRLRKKKRGFTIVDNNAFDDMSISIEAVGVYCIFRRWASYEAEDFVCSKTFIFSKSRCKEKKFERIWKELKEAGYIKMYCVGKANWSAELLEDPEPDTPHTYYLNSAGEVKRTVSTGDSNTEDLSPPHLRGDLASGDLESGGLGEGNNINTLNKNSSDNNSLLIPSINPTEKDLDFDTPPVLETTDRLIDKETLKNIKEQIQYDYLLNDVKISRDNLDLAVLCIAELYTTTKEQQFNGHSYSPDFIRKRSFKIEHDHIEYVFDCFAQQEGEIKNVRKYLMTAIFNAPDTIGAYYSNRVAARIKD